MPTRRMIDPAFWQSESVMEMNREERLFFIGLISNADDQGRLKAHPKVLRAQICMGDHDVSVEMIEAWLDGIAALDCIFLYKTGGRRFVQIINWWKYQFPQWAYPSKIPPPEGWHDRLRYRAGNEIITKNWNGDVVNGFGNHSHDDYPNLGNGSGKDIPKPLPKDKGKGMDYAHSIVESSIEIGLEQKEKDSPSLTEIFGPAEDHSAEITGPDSHQRHIDQGLNGGSPSDPAEEIAKHLFWGVRDNPTLQLPKPKAKRKPWLAAADSMLAEVPDWVGLCRAIDDWFENTPADDQWTKTHITNPHNTELTGKIVRHYGRMKKRQDSAQAEQPETSVRERPEEEVIWAEAVQIIRDQFPNIVHTRPLKRRTNGKLQIEAGQSICENCNHRKAKINQALAGWMAVHQISDLQFVQAGSA